MKLVGVQRWHHEDDNKDPRCLIYIQYSLIYHSSFLFLLHSLFITFMKSKNTIGVRYGFDTIIWGLYYRLQDPIFEFQ